MGGRVIGGLDFVNREPSAWWREGERGTKPRDAEISLLVGHGTGGPPRTGPQAGPRVVRAMKSRLRADGLPMNVGVHFVVGADGLVWQTADLAIATIHVGNSGVNTRSIGVECSWPVFESAALRLNVTGRLISRRVAGRRVSVVEPPEEMIASWVRLAETLASVVGIARQVPLDASGGLMSDRFTKKQQRGWIGAQEHMHVPSPSRKIDAAGVLVGALRDAGWRGVIA